MTTEELWEMLAMWWVRSDKLLRVWRDHDVPLEHQDKAFRLYMMMFKRCHTAGWILTEKLNLLNFKKCNLKQSKRTSVKK